MKKLLLLVMAVVLVGCCTRPEPPEAGAALAPILPNGTISPTGGFPPGIKGKPAPEPLRLPDGLIGKRVPKPLR